MHIPAVHFWRHLTLVRDSHVTRQRVHGTHQRVMSHTCRLFLALSLAPKRYILGPPSKPPAVAGRIFPGAGLFLFYLCKQKVLFIYSLIFTCYSSLILPAVRHCDLKMN